jgi:hypothetical protein
MPATLVRFVAAGTVTCMLGASLPLTAQAKSTLASEGAAVVGTEAVAASEATRARSEQLRGLLDRVEVRRALADRGVDPAQLQARVDSLTDDEAARIARHLDDLPAGASDVLGVLFAVFIILLVTDILGLTKVFPFTRSVR